MQTYEVIRIWFPVPTIASLITVARYRIRTSKSAKGAFHAADVNSNKNQEMLNENLKSEL